MAPNKHDFDKDGIMDGVEMGLLVTGTDTIDLEEIYGSEVTIQFPIEEIGWWIGCVFVFINFSE
ncbi:MAG: hypothetical protein ACFFBI_04200 [Promethearchaeota archaeon]